jgi:hypothetical protein
MGYGKTKSGRAYARPISVLIVCSFVTCVSFSLTLGMCLAVASVVAQVGHAIDEAVASFVGNLLLSVLAGPSWIVVGWLTLAIAVAWVVLTADWGELVWLFLALLGWLLSEGVL